jgi:hypothetical protein
MNELNRQVFGMIIRCRNAEKRTTSKAGSVLVSKAADSVNGINKVKIIADFVNGRTIKDLDIEFYY